MKRTIAYSFLTALLFSTFVSAQFRIKIPKIKKPKVLQGEQAKTSTDNVKTRSMVLDDGFTFFDAEVVEVLDTRLHRMTDKGWTLKSHLRLFGDFPRRSGFNVVVSKAGRVLAKTRCGATRVPQPNSYEAQRGLYGDHYIYTKRHAGCMNKKRVVRAIGKMDVLIYFFNGETDEETLVRKYKIDVHKATRVRGPVKRTVAAVPHYYISRHQDVPASIMYLSADYAFNYFNDNGYSSYPNQVQIYFNYSPKSFRRGKMPKGYVRCFVNGKFVRLPGSGDDFDKVFPSSLRWESGTYMDRLAPQYRRGGEYKDEVAFYQVAIALPLSWGRKTAKRQVDRLNIRDYPGKWKCDYKYDGETIRTFRWTIGSDRMPVKHPEQQNRNINLFYNSYLIETEIPAGGSEFDYRLAPMPNKGFFYGRPWTSIVGKAMAAKVPRKGRLYQVPSNRRR